MDYYKCWQIFDHKAIEAQTFFGSQALEIFGLTIGIRVFAICLFGLTVHLSWCVDHSGIEITWSIPFYKTFIIHFYDTRHWDER